MRSRLVELGLGEAAFERRTRLYPRGWAMAGGWHGVTLPWTTAANGLPLGLQLVGRFMDDERLLAWAAQLVRRTAAVRA